MEAADLLTGTRVQLGAVKSQVIKFSYSGARLSLLQTLKVAVLHESQLLRLVELFYDINLDM